MSTSVQAKGCRIWRTVICGMGACSTQNRTKWLQSKKADTTSRSSFEHNVGLLLVQPYSDCIQLNLEKSSLFFGFGSIEHHEDEISSFCRWTNHQFYLDICSTSLLTRYHLTATATTCPYELPKTQGENREMWRETLTSAFNYTG
jgi:hypothetical protein